MAAAGAVWAASSKDYDSLLFGAPRLVRFLTISGKEFLPSRGTFRPILPEAIELQRVLDVGPSWARFDQPSRRQPLEMVDDGARSQPQVFGQLFDGVWPRSEQTDDPKP